MDKYEWTSALHKQKVIMEAMNVQIKRIDKLVTGHVNMILNKAEITDMEEVRTIVANLPS